MDKFIGMWAGLTTVMGFWAAVIGIHLTVTADVSFDMVPYEAAQSVGGLILLVAGFTWVTMSFLFWRRN